MRVLFRNYSLMEAVKRLLPRPRKKIYNLGACFELVDIPKVRGEKYQNISIFWKNLLLVQWSAKRTDSSDSEGCRIIEFVIKGMFKGLTKFRYQFCVNIFKFFKNKLL